MIVLFTENFKATQKHALAGESMINENFLIKEVEKEMLKLLERKRPEKLYKMMLYHLGFVDEKFRKASGYKGKRIRPLLCILSYASLSNTYEKALPLAAGIELIHNFTLIHDDIEDRDEVRRHKPTLWKLFGEAHAINAGDGMHALSNIATLGLIEKNVSPEKIVEIISVLNATVLELCEGQFLDMSFEKRRKISINEYLEMIGKKTAALISASCYTGAILGTENREIRARFKNFGYNIGIAFQIVDDIIGIWGKEEKTGKPEKSDIEKKKKSMPIVYAFEKAKKGDAEKLMKIYSKKKISKEDREKVVEILEKINAKEQCQKIAEDYKKNAMKELNKTGINNSAMLKIREIAKFLTKRDF